MKFKVALRDEQCSSVDVSQHFVNSVKIQLLQPKVEENRQSLILLSLWRPLNSS